MRQFKVLLLVMMSLFVHPTIICAQYEKNTDGINFYYSKLADSYCVVNSQYSGDIVIPNYYKGKKVTEISNRAFNNSEITSITLPLTLTEIGEEAFAGCKNITTIEIPQNVSLINQKAFAECEKLKDIYCYAPNPSLGVDALYKVKGFILHVPEKYIEQYKNHYQWKKAKKIVATTSPSSAFEREKLEMAEIQAKNAELNKKIADEFKMAEEGNVDAMIGLAQRYLNGEGVDKDNKKAFQFYKKAAEHGNADAQYYIASCYYYGNNVDKNVDTALSWIIKSANQGNIKAKKLQEEYNKQYGSYFTDNTKWRIVYSDGGHIERDASKNNIKFSFKYEDKAYYFMIYNVDISTLGITEVINDENKKLTINESGVGDGLWIAFNEGYDLPLEKIEKIIKEVFLKKFVIGNYKVESVIWYKVKYEGTYRHTQVVLEYYKGKYLSNKEFGDRIKAQEAAKIKEEQAQIAPFVRRFGFDPTKKSIKQLVIVGRSYQLLVDYFKFLKSDHDLKFHSGGTYFTELSTDRGNSKCYQLRYAGGYLGGNTYTNIKTLGFFWIRNGKISSVTWY